MAFARTCKTTLYAGMLAIALAPAASPTCAAHVMEVHAERGADLSKELASHVDSGQPVVVRGGVSHWVPQVAQWWSVGSSAVATSASSEDSAMKAFVERFADATVIQTTAAQRGFFGDTDANARRLQVASILAGEDRELVFATSDPVWKQLLPPHEWRHLLESMGGAMGRRKGEAAPQTITSIGGAGVGLPFHVHEDSVLGLALGTKHWIVAPLHRLSEELLSHSMRTHADDAWCPSPGAVAGAQHALCVTQHPGDVVFVPAFWWHATRNGDGLTV